MSTKVIFHVLLRLNRQTHTSLCQKHTWVTTMGAPIRYSGSVSLRYWPFLLDRGIGLTWPIQFDTLHSYYCVIVKPHKSYKHIIKCHKVSVHYISSVLKQMHILMWGTDEYLSQVDVNTSLRCSCPSSSIQRSNCVPRSVTRVKTINYLHCSYYTSLDL